MRKGEYVDFAYTGNVQQFIVPNSAVYKFEVWGGSGGKSWFNSTNSNSMGGYAVGYKKFAKGTTLFICVGGKGYHDGKNAGVAGYNGGGGGWIGDAGGPWGNWGSSGTGGGATHIALVDGTLLSIGKETFDANGLIVAGGGSGAMYYRSNGSSAPSFYGDLGGNQTASYSFGKGENSTGSCNANGTWTSGPGGGGGYYGGSVKKGGSSWIDGVEDFKDYTKSMTAGGNSLDADGKARITLMQKSNKKYGELDVVCYYGAEEVERHFGTLDI